MAVNSDYVRERLIAYIYPRTPSDEAQEEAFENAVNAQVEYESENETIAAPPGVAAISNDGVSVSFESSRVTGGAYSIHTISPAAYAYLYNAGLIRHTLPVARRL